MIVIGSGMYGEHLSNLLDCDNMSVREFKEHPFYINQDVVYCGKPKHLESFLPYFRKGVVDVTPASRGREGWEQWLSPKRTYRTSKISLPGCMTTAVLKFHSFFDASTLRPGEVFKIDAVLGASVAGSEIVEREFSQLGVNCKHAQFDEIKRWTNVKFSFNPTFGSFKHGIYLSTVIDVYRIEDVNDTMFSQDDNFIVTKFDDYDLVTMYFDNFKGLDGHVIDALSYISNITH